MLRRKPIILRWPDGRVSLGYLGELRWRVAAGGDTIEVATVGAAVAAAFEAVFRGVAPGEEVAARSPLELDLPDGRLRFVAAAKFVNGWKAISRQIEQDVGDHRELLGFVAERVARAAEAARVRGAPERHAPLKRRFSFAAFSKAADPNALCRELEAVLNDRLRAHPAPAVAFVEAMQELKRAGHDLWSHTPDEQWGFDYMTPRPGAGLHVTRFTEWDEGQVPNTVAVEFEPSNA